MSILEAGQFLQFKHIPSEGKPFKYEVKPGIRVINANSLGYKLDPTSFVNDAILEEFVSTKEIEDIVDCFFNNLHLYEEFGIEVPKRGVLLWGPQGAGKTTALSKCTRKYDADGRTAIIIWDTNKFESHEVKSFFKSFEYKDVDKLILVAEDLGGSSNDQQRMRSDSSLLSLLDNQEKTFTIPTMIIATTNNPEAFAANITNRPGRFDDKIEVGYPSAKSRCALLKFFAKDYACEESMSFVASTKCSKFTPSQLKEAYIRSRLRSQTLISTLHDMVKDMDIYDTGFTKNKKVGL